jgi:tetraacyldisaccharide 4'-kinase
MRKLAGKLYAKVADLRNLMYDRGTLKSYDLEARTISVGNFTAGGTGKTPLVGYIAELLAENGEKVCVLTRGYGRRNENDRVLVSDGTAVLADVENGGDEPVELAQQLLGKAIIVADADRVAAARWAKEEFEITFFVLDDGFQHRRARRGLDIVCIDAMDPFGNRTLLRESVSGLGRANAVVITRADALEDVGELSAQLRQYNPQAPIFTARTRIVSLRPISDGERSIKEPTKSFSFCAVGNPKAFFETLRRDGIEVTGTRAFRDHHRYTQADINDLEKAAAASGADALLTTGKDAVKLQELKFSLPCFVVEIETTVQDSDEFKQLLLTSS